MKLRLFCTLIIGINSFANLKAKEDENEIFSGRVSSYSKEAKIVKFKVQFNNIKYLNKLDKVEFWTQHQQDAKCEGIILGRSPDYLLLKVPKYRSCAQINPFTTGRYYYFHSQDLLNNISMGKDLVEILVKKRLALTGKVNRNDKEINTYISRTEAVNNRYEILQKKLQAEWREELARLEMDQTEVMRNNEGLKMRLNEVNHKLEQYRVEDKNLTQDRWALDPNYYYLK